eukprot:m.13037 g.13037  ORF g.13037 m.13037 type:complete len:174 (+) comp10084_c0_seq1:99-620(+)
MGQESSMPSKADIKVPPPSNTEAHPACTACSEPTPEQDQKARQRAAQGQAGKTPYAYMHSGCPLNRRELGRASWAFLHTMAAFYPEHPTEKQQEDMSNFMWTFATVYPCGYCGDTTWQEMARHPPQVTTQKDFALWMCELHNEVNDRLGKPQFDCSKVDERWRTGPTDGSCDQ